MENKVNYVRATNFINLFYTRGDEGNSKHKAASRKIGVAILYKFFSNCELCSYFRSFGNH